jgi:FtsZ-interacting cell division protein ZipA
MDLIVWLLIIAAILIVVIVVALFAARRRRERLQERFGPEYDRQVDVSGNRRAAESELAAREKRRSKLEIRPLDPDARDRYLVSWREVQAKFVDSPEKAVGEADQLVGDVMRERGYPVEDFEQREADISVDHPQVASEYRAAHGISLAQRHGQASTEDLRQAVVHYRALFEELLEIRQEEAPRRS